MLTRSTVTNRRPITYARKLNMSILAKGAPWFAALSAAVLLGACGGSGSSPATGRVSVSLTDMPVDHADQVVIAVSGVAFKPEGSGPEHVVDFSPRSINLLQYQNGQTAVLLQTSPWKRVATSGCA
jgi:hypothetical protein